jgi:hypothetical protein
MGGTCDTHGTDENIKFCSENLKERDHSNDLGIDGRIILELILGEIGWGNVDWMRLAQDKDQ